MCKDRYWLGAQDEMFQNNPCCRHHRCKYLNPIFRIVAQVFHLQALITQQVYLGSRWYKQLAFMTTWGFFMTEFTFIFLMILSLPQCRTKRCHKCVLRCVHTLYSISLSLGIMILIVFWVGLFPILLKEDKARDPVFYWIQVQLHLITQIFMVMDFINSAIYFFKWQYFVVLGVSFVYMMVNLVITLTSFTVYPILTWKDGMTPVWLIACFLLMTGSFFFFWWLGQKKKKQLERRREMQDSGSNIVMQESLIKGKIGAFGENKRESHIL